MDINLLLDTIEKNLPHETAMEGDRIGLQIYTGKTDIKNILVTMELNDAVIDEALSIKSDCIITFHPLIFYPLTIVDYNDRVGRLSSALIKNDISLISIHTNFDAYINGTSRLLCDKLGLNYDSFLVPDKHYENFGMGAICYSDENLTLNALLKRVSDTCNSPLRYCHGKDDGKISKIAIVGGSGSSFIDDALKAKADVLITADISYHNFHRVERKMALIDPGHYEMEQFVTKGLHDFLASKIEENVNLYISHAFTNPVRYYPENDYTKKQKLYYK